MKQKIAGQQKSFVPYSLAALLLILILAHV